MELRLYWGIVRQRWWLAAGLVAVALATYLVFPPTPPSGYTASMRFVVGVRPEPATGQYYTFDRYYTWLTAEYLVDDLAEVVKSAAFAQDVAALANLPIPPGAISGATAAGKLHRILTVTVSWHDAQELAHLTDALVRVLLEQGDRYFAQLATESALLSLIDPPQTHAIGASLRQRLELPIRLALALLAGVALAFLLDYLDITVRDRRDLEPFGLPLLAEIPSERPRWRPLRGTRLP